MWSLKFEYWDLKFPRSSVKLEILNLDIERDLEGSVNHFFTECLKSKWAWWVLETSEKEHFLRFLKIQMGLTRFRRVWKSVFYQTFKIQMDTMRFGIFWKNNFLRFFKNPNGPDKVWKGLKTSFLQMRFGRFWRIVF